MDNNSIIGGEPSRFAFQNSQYLGEVLPCSATVFNRSIDNPGVGWCISTRQTVEQALEKGVSLDLFIGNSNYLKFCEQQIRKQSGEKFLQLSESEKLQQWVNSLKNSLPCFIFAVAGFQPTMVKDKDGKEHPFCRRKQEAIIALSGFFMADFDHLAIDPKELFQSTQVNGFPWQLCLAHKNILWSWSAFGL